MKQYLLYITLTLLLLTACKSGKYAELGDGIYADIQTTQGDIVVKLHHKATPITVANFVSLAEGTNPFVSDEYKEKKYYDGLTFHRVMKDFMIQGGDPLASGSGSPGYKFKDELVDTLKHSKKGILSMANPGFKANGSQFFITHKATPWLDGYDENGNLKPCQNPKVYCHAVFGEVVYGIEVVDSIANVKTDSRDKPLTAVVMNKVEIIRNGKEAKQFDPNQILSDYFKEEEEMEAAYQQMKDDFVAETQEQIELAEETSSGLKILTLIEGSGEKPKTGQRVNVLYAGYLANGKLFDSNFEEVAKKYNIYDQRRKAEGGYEPFPMLYSPEAQLVAGFKEGLQSMKVGDKVRLFVPPHLGYGDRDYGPIPANSTLIFDLEITGIAK